ncbi:MAG: polysaccharide deacetylase family protein [Betaproteobacteria bacterium]|nr:polysaccharide deacetylase family protein [Betaproteobacteria bacterium]
MIPSKRLEYSAIIDRPPLKLPGAARLVVWPVINVEVWDIARPMPRQVLPPPTHITRLPDFAHWAWHEYGMRVGFWRLKEFLDGHGIKASLFTNARVCQDYRRVAEAARDAGWEFVGHSYDQRPIHTEPDQRAMIQRTVRIIREFTGRQPVGWLGPGLTETLYTPDYLAEAGIRYIADWVIDDEPCEMKTAHGPVVAMPYSVELNDIPMMMVQHHAADEFVTRCMDHFERVYEESKTRAKIMAIAVHPYISGVPHRIKYFETVFERLKKQKNVVFWTGEQILDWYLKIGQLAGKAKRGR